MGGCDDALDLPRLLYYTILYCIGHYPCTTTTPNKTHTKLIDYAENRLLPFSSVYYSTTLNHTHTHTILVYSVPDVALELLHRVVQLPARRLGVIQLRHERLMWGEGV